MKAKSGSEPESRGRAHFKRWATGLSALPVLIGCVVAGGGYFALLVGTASLVCLWEFFRIVRPAGAPAVSDPTLISGYVSAVLLIGAAHAGQPELIPAVLALNVLFCALVSVLRFVSDRSVPELAARQTQGVCYIPLMLALLILVRAGADGMLWVFALCAVVFAGDIAALYAGTFWGRHKLSPAVSPGKTVEGALAGLAANAVVGAAAKVLLFPGLPWGHCLLFSIAVGIAGQVGDLFESALKRAAGVKDSSSLLPGHGGVLDRLDALLFASPVAFAFRMYIYSA
jgi:phosphatidate cytidylyltransferase